MCSRSRDMSHSRSGQNRRMSRWYVAVGVGIAVATTGYVWRVWRDLDSIGNGIPSVMSRFPLVNDSDAQPIQAGSGLFVHGTMVAVLQTIKKIPFSVGSRDTILLLSGEWLSAPPASMLKDSMLTVSVQEVPGGVSPVTGLLSSGLHGEFLGVVRLENPPIAVRLQLVKK